MDLSSIEDILARGANEDPAHPLTRCQGCGVVYDLPERRAEVAESQDPNAEVEVRYHSDRCYRTKGRG